MDSLESTEGNRDELILKQQRDIEKEVIVGNYINALQGIF